MAKIKKRNTKKKALNAFEVEDVKIKQKSLDHVEDMRYHVDFIKSDDDEEIDSDEAYGDGDEVTAGVRSKKKEEEELRYSDVEEELAGEGFVDLSEMLGEDKKTTKVENVENVQNSFDAKELMAQSDSEGDIEDYSFSEDEENEENETEDNNKLDNLEKLLDSMPKNRVQKYLSEKKENYKENEFNLGSALNTSNKLNIEDLLAPVQDQGEFVSLEKKAAKMVSKIKQSKLKAPLAKRLQDRIERKAALLEAKDRISVWEPVITANRTADHIDFSKPAIDTATTGSISAPIKLETEMEKEIQEILNVSKVHENKIKEKEELEMVHLNPEEALKRQKELKKLRELMFRNEAKAKRVSKIKSKSYRRVHKKEREKAEQLERELNGEMDEDDYDAEVARARERMTLKHKNTSKWAKSLLNQNSNHKESQLAIQEQLKEHERLTKKIKGEANSSDEGEDDDYSGEEYEGDIQKLDKLIQEPEGAISKGVMGMKFMQTAMAKKQQELEKMAEEAKRDILLLQTDEFGNYIHDTVDTEEADNLVEGNKGRMAFGGNEKIGKSKVNSINSINEPEKISREEKPKETATTFNNKKIENTDKNNTSEQENPWLQDNEAFAKKKRNITKNNVVDKAQKNSNKIKKAKLGDNKSQEVNIDLALTLEHNQNEGSEGEEVNVHGDVDMIPVEKDTVFTQKELVEMAFADDHVITEFEQEKEKAIEEQGDKTNDAYLPGWGTWGGLTSKKMNEDQLKEFKIKKNLIKVVKKGVNKDQRKDKDLNNVIINENKNPKLLKYTVRNLPFPYQSVQQYEMGLKNPIGKEWNPATTYSKRIKPKVITKKGQIIDPLKMKDH
ncbi:small-subunit processome [Neoconidiobolus thromboides FSU 785]|nr:small-subunit processome [Neoconidiobolus thromboides FSU 785]